MLSQLIWVFISLVFQQASGIVANGVPRRAKLYDQDHPHAIPDSYIIMFKGNYSVAQHWQAIGVDLSNTTGFISYDLFGGYAATLNTRMLELIRGDHNLDSVRADLMLQHRSLTPKDLTSNGSTTRSSQASAKMKRKYQSFVDSEAPFNLRMVGAGVKLGTPVRDGNGYEYVKGAGSGAVIYFFDGGIRISHSLFEGRAFNFGGLGPNDYSPYCANSKMTDSDGHGTHVAGIAAARHYGVAPYAHVVNVKIRCDPMSEKLAAKAMEDVSREHLYNIKNKPEFRGSVAYLSLGGYGSAGTLKWAVGWARWYGINFVAPANNDNADTAYDWPCYWGSVMCVGAVDDSYVKTFFSGHGKEIDYLAPGSLIWSLASWDDKDVVDSQGTSQAAAHLAGLTAIFVSWKKLRNGGGDGYVWSNSLSGITSGWPWFWVPSTKNYFATSGIQSTKKYPNEPFRYGKDDPSELSLQSGAVPIFEPDGTVDPNSDANTYVPAFAGETSVDTTTTEVTTSTITANPDPDRMSTGSLDVGDLRVTFSDELPSSLEPIIPGYVLSDLGVTDLDKPTAAPSPLQTSSSANGACQDNQVEGSCTQAYLPSSTPDSGPIQPVCYKVDSSPDYLMFNAAQASDGVSEYCAGLISSKVTLSASTSNPNPGYVAGAAEPSGYIALVVQFDVDSCDPNTPPSSQQLDFGSWTQENCYTYLYSNLAQDCQKDSTWSNFDPQHSLEGGVYGAACALWSIAGLPGSPPGIGK